MRMVMKALSSSSKTSLSSTERTATLSNRLIGPAAYCSSKSFEKRAYRSSVSKSRTKEGEKIPGVPPERRF